MGQKSTKNSTRILTRELNGGESEPLYIGLHFDDPGRDGDQSTNEVSYPGYARSAVPRSGQWEIKDGRASNSQMIDWPMALGRGKAAKFFSLGTSASGRGELIRWGRLSKPKDGLEIVPGMIPRALPGTLTLTES